MSHEFDRRTLLRMSALGLAVPVLAANSARYISNLVVEDVTVGGVPVTG
jgi:hypothetical protein